MIISDRCVNCIYEVSVSQLKHAVLFPPFSFSLLVIMTCLRNFSFFSLKLIPAKRAFGELIHFQHTTMQILEAFDLPFSRPARLRKVSLPYLTEPLFQTTGWESFASDIRCFHSFLSTTESFILDRGGCCATLGLQGAHDLLLVVLRSDSWWCSGDHT